MRDIQRVLILGTGPVAVQLAVLFKKSWGCGIGIAGRRSQRSDRFFASLAEAGQRVRIDVQNGQHRSMEGECIVDEVFQDYRTIHGEWDMLVFAVSTDAYIEVLGQIDRAVLRQASCAMLVSPTFGSGFVVSDFLHQAGSGAEVISCSTYLGDTRWADGQPAGHVVTAAVKRKLYLGSTNRSSATVNRLNRLYEQSGIATEIMASPLEAETRNSSLYVHPPLFMNDFSLRAVFGETKEPKYVYKMFPEGPITQQLIRNMRLQWEEIGAIMERLHVRSLNLLQFMTDDNYPVRPESLSRQDIDQFPYLEAVHQEYLLYVRYTSLLIDPYSTPDEQGRYFDFSAVPIRIMYVNQDGEWDLPRMPKEDYYRTKIIQGIARYVGVASPMIDSFISIYENKLSETAARRKNERLSSAFAVQSFDEDIKRIGNGIAQLSLKITIKS
ncbi:hypothetical protein FHS18_003511 [Paenibacillus phyllosphaerae]|uniref:DUF2338 family protein n=1 Tax=Paenibacillus phyllosphaerae TaxID=274593 RepID=A0A7W5AZ79_9BACL|nr:opine metallophore biosynthesis dehydrogenase [Paenibacillus phyllosphaerae]MBB3111443.1 hypothetical protein [Paenibacillus phyllosphaerae]